MRRVATFAATLLVVLGLSAAGASGQSAPKPVTLASGQSVDLRPIFWVLRVQGCRSLLKKIEAIEVLESPAEVTVSIREGLVSPPDCPKKVPGAIITLSAKTISAPSQGTLVFRAKLSTQDGDRIAGYLYTIELKP
jgi:hypothetical protein